MLAPLGGLHHICVGSGDLLRLARPLTDAAAECLGALLPVTDVAEVEGSAAAASGSDVRSRMMANFGQAAPLVPGKEEGSAELSADARQRGRQDAGRAGQTSDPESVSGALPGQADLMFCREQGNLHPDDLQRLLRVCRAAYKDLAMVPTASPHARFDITDWVPLDP